MKRRNFLKVAVSGAVGEVAFAGLLDDLASDSQPNTVVIRDVFQDYWDFQDRWNRRMPRYARDMAPVAIKTASQEARQFSQIPILAWGVELV